MGDVSLCDLDDESQIGVDESFAGFPVSVVDATGERSLLIGSQKLIVTNLAQVGVQIRAVF
jgi:hypothetical protein